MIFVWEFELPFFSLLNIKKNMFDEIVKEF